MESKKNRRGSPPLTYSPPADFKEGVDEETYAFQTTLALRPTHQFYRTLLSFCEGYQAIKLSHRSSPATTMKKMGIAISNIFSLQSDESPIAATLAQLNKALKMYQPAMLSLENGRFGNETTEYCISEEQSNEFEEARAELKAATEDRDQLPLRYAEAKDFLATQVAQITEEITAHITKKIALDLAKKQQRDSRLLVLGVEKVRQDAALDKIQEKIDNSCCHCCSPFQCHCCLPEEELKEKAKIEKALQENKVELEKLAKESKIDSEEKDTELAKLEQDKANKKKEHADLIKQHPGNLSKAAERVEQAEAHLVALNQTIEAEAREWYADLSREMMFVTLRVYEQFSKLCKLVKAQFETLASSDQSDSKLYENLNRLCVDYQNDINTNFFHLFWCSESNDIKFSELYERFSETNSSTQEALLTQEVTEKLMGNLLEKEVGSLKEELRDHHIAIPSTFFSPKFCLHTPQPTMEGRYRSLLRLPASVV